MHRHLSDTRLFTLEQARQYLEVYRPATATTAAASSSQSPGSKNGRLPTCRKCKAAGLKGRGILHKTENCNAELRSKNLKKFADSQQAKWPRELSANLSDSNKRFKKAPKIKFDFSSVQSEAECKYCKRAGRKFRHPSKSCKFAPGGAWHNKTGEELRALQKQYFESRKRARGGNNSTNTAAQAKPFRKRARGGRESQESSLLATQPLWERHFTLMSEQEPWPEEAIEALPFKTTQNELGGVSSTPGCEEGCPANFKNANFTPGYKSANKAEASCSRETTVYELLVSEREKAARSEIPDEKDYLATLMAENMAGSLDTAIVPYDSSANKFATGQELVPYQPKSAGCQICEYRKAAKYRYENRHMPDYATMSEKEKGSGLAKGATASTHTAQKVRPLANGDAWRCSTRHYIRLPEAQATRLISRTNRLKI